MLRHGYTNKNISRISVNCLKPSAYCSLDFPTMSEIDYSVVRCPFKLLFEIWIKITFKSVFWDK